MSGYDPGGGDQPSRGSTPDLTSLQENFSQQQAKITALRELVRATESAQGKKTASAQEKVKNIAQRLTQYKTKATKSRLSRASSSEVDLMSTRINEETTEVEVDSSFANISGVAYEEQQHMSLPVARARSETPGSEKVNLLRQQMEQNRLKMAARESQKREVEERVIELKHKLEASQHTLEQSTAEFGRSTGDLSGLLLGPPAVTPVKMGRFEFNKSTSDLTQMVAGGGGLTSSLEVERLRYLEGRVKVLEQELANQPSSDERVKELERKILDLEEALKEKECVIEARTQAVSLMTENLTAKGRNTVDLLEDTKQEMLRMQTNFVQAEASLKQELDRLQVELDERSAKVSNLEEMNNILETARYDLTVENSTLRQSLEDVQDFATKISELNKLNQSLQHRITELEGSRYEFITDAEVEQARREGESDERVRELEERVRELEETGDLAEKVRSLEATIEAQREQLEGQSKVYEELQEQLQEKTVELNVLNANFSVLQEKLKTAGPKQLFPKSAEEEAEGETSKLKQQLDEANKGAIKSKLKIKQLQKQVDSFKKTSAVHEEVVRLTEEVQTLTQRLAEVEEEKGNLQLHLVNYDGSLPDSELEKRIKILETTCQNQTQAIQLLEEQKLDMDEDLNATRHELETMRESSKVADQGTTSIQSQMTSIEYEEKFEQCVTDREELRAQIGKLESERTELQQKLERYMCENIELLDRIEKLSSVEKVSSAESIEIVEGLTASEKQEIEGYEAAAKKKKMAAAAGEGGEEGVDEGGAVDEADRVGGDKNKKLQIAKKLAGDAKNLGRLAGGLLAEVDGSSGLREQIMEMTHAQIEKIEQIELLREEVERKREEIDELKRHLEAKAEKSSSDDEPELLKVELNSRNDEIRELKKELESLAARKTVEVEEVQSRLKGAGNEIDILKELVQEQKQQLIDTYQEHEHDIAGKLKEIQNYENEAKQMREEIERLSRLVEQNSERFDEAMKQQLEQLQEQQDEISHKQETIDTLNAQIIDLYKTMEENANRVIEKEDELQYLQELLDAKKDEVETLHQQLVEVRKQLESAERRLQEALATPAVDEGRVQELDAKNKEQLEKLKKFAANLKKKNVQCQELEDKLAKAQQELEEAKQASPSDDLREENEQLSQKMHHLNNELHKLLQQKYTLETSGQQSQHDLLTLQEKYQQLEDRVQQGESKLQQVAYQLAEKLQEFQTVSEDLASKNVKIEKCKAIIKEKNKEIQRLQEHERKTAYLEDEIKMSQSKLEDFHNQTLQLGRLKADKEDLNAALKAESEKVRQLELDLELADEQSRKLRDQIAKLERGISLVEQRRNSLERQKKLLGEALDERTQEYSEHEDELMRRLANLTQHDEAIEHKLKEKEDELLELGETLRDVEHQRDQLQTRLNDLERQAATHEEATRRSAELESDNFGLGQQVAALQAEVKRVQGEAEGRVAEKDSEIDQLEVELTNQLAKIENERKLLQEGLERARDENVDLRDEVVRLQENVNSFEQTRADLEKEVTWLRMQNESLTQDSNELQELRMQIVQDQTELENLRGQCETLVQNHQCEIQALKQQIADMEAIRTQLSQNQTDDQVQVQNEMRKLKGLLELKEEEILGLRAGKLQADGDLEELKRQLEALEQSLKRDEALEQQLEKKSSELEAMSKQLFPTMQAEPIAGTSQFFAGQPESTAISLFDSAGDGWGWDEPVVTQQAHQEVSAVPEVDEVGQLRAQIEELQAKLAAITDHDDEFHQLKDELDILRAQNSSLSYEIAEKASKLKHIAATLQAEQLRASVLEEQLEKWEADSAAPSVSSFFTDSTAPVFEELVVPKVTYQCKPSVSVEEPMFATAVAGSQHAAPSQDCAVDEELAKLKAASVEQCQRIEDQVRQLLQLQELNGSLQQKLEEQNEVVGELRREVEKLLETNQQQKQQEDQLKQEIENLVQTKQQGDNQISQLRQEVERLLEENTRQQQLKETELEQLRASNQQHQDNQVGSLRQEVEQLSTTNQQFLAEQKSLKEALNSLQQHNELEQTRTDLEREQLQHELSNLKQLNESLQQDRDTFLQLQDELDIVRAQNASLQQELQDKSDRIKRLASTLTETEARVGQLEATTTASFFGGVAAQPAAEVFEEIIQPKKAFQLDEEDCWGGEEALLEEQHQRKSSERDDYIRQLELEKERLQQEITELKVKSGKLLKKVKEYKAKSESLEQRRSASIETSELDLAIQEELNAQVRGLEGKLKEVQAERESLLKRVDVLTAANDRFAEMKERQDGQIEVQLAKIRELSGKLQQLEDWGDDSTEKEVKPAVVEAGQVTSAEVEELRKEVDDLRVDNEELQALLEEEKANVEILEKRVAQKDGEIQELIEKIDGLSQDSRTIKTSLESLNQQKSQETVELSQKLKELMGRNTELTQQIESMRSESLFQNSEQEVKLQEQVQQLSAQLQYKEAEIVHLSERIEQQAREDQTQSLVQEILGKNQEISALKARLQQLQSEHQDLQSNLTLQITKELAGSRPEDDKSAKLAELERANRDLLEEKHQMEQELQVLNDQVIASLEFEDRMKGIVLELDAKNIEIEALKASLETLKQSAASSSSSEQSTPTASKEQAGDETIRKQLQKLQKERADLEANYRITLEQRDAHWQHVVEERGAQVAESWKQHVDLREAEFTVIEKSLREEIERLQSQNPNPPQAAAEPAAIVQMKEALEAQELEIVTLKEQLAIRSAEYARLAAQVDPFAVKHAMNMVTSEPKPVDNGDKVPRSELELALYMIYQRDMRCEELELELRNLLEERDALQLRLSNALRLQEEFKRKFNAPVGEASGDSSDLSKTTTPEKSLQQIVQESGIGAATTTTVPEELSSKLSELHSIGHSRDKRQQEDRQERHRQLALIQRDLANMPLEAAARITGGSVGAPSESSSPNQQQHAQQQSASSVLINWILGKKSDT
ncbi:protein lava lamp-like [Culex pipiens pallens]|uniref:protein lava lamp-like n=1 Tax=Culex pipiens pallens TaxID=42434 RepID=UPI0022AB2F0D|nr:protein lava lamp-like [Culex pipiens pallens]